MYCKKCLGTIEADEKFCTRCGTPVERKDVEEIKVAEGENFASAIDGLELKDKVEESPVEKTQVQKQEVHSGPNIYNKPPTSSKPSPNAKVVDKSGEFIIGIIGVIISFLTSLVIAIVYVGFGALGLFAESTDTMTSGNGFMVIMMVILGLKGFVFAFLGLIGVLNVKKNSQIAGLFFLSAAVGSILSIQLIRGGFFVAAGIICLTRHEKVEGPILKYVLAAFIPTFLVLLLVLINFILLIISGDESSIEGINSVYIMVRNFA